MNKKLLFAPLITLALAGCSINVHNYYEYEDSDKYTEYKEETTISEEASKLNIDWVSGNISIQEGNVLSIKEEIENNNKYYPLYYRMNEGLLDIKFCKSGIDLEDNFTKKLTITIPSTIKEVSVANVSGKINLQSNNVDTLSIAAVSTNIDVNLAKPKNIQVASTSGNVKIEAKDVTVLEEIDVAAISANIDFYLDDLRGYNLDLSQTSGSIEKEFTDGTDASLSKYNLKVAVISGNVSIRKKI